jgi:magnesium transporter
MARQDVAPAGGRTHLLSSLVRYRLEDADGHTTRLVDFTIDLAQPDYPSVDSFIYRGPSGGASLVGLPANQLRRVDPERRRIEVESLSSGRELDDQTLERSVLLKRGVRDALVLDVERCVTTRVNDVVLRDTGGKLLVDAADLSPWAVIRWFGGGRLKVPRRHDLLDWAHVEFLRGDPQIAERSGDLHRRVDHLHPPEIARMMDALPYLHAAELLTLTEDRVAADALEIMTRESQVQVFEELEAEYGARLLGLVAPDAAADLLGSLDAELAQGYLELVAEPARGRILALLSYPPDSAGGIMTNHLVTVPAGVTVQQARPSLREQMSAPDFVYYVYVVGGADHGRLMGVLTLRDLLVADDASRMDELMLQDILTIDPSETAAAAARRVSDVHLAALPVVDGQGVLLGAVTFDAAMSQLAPPSWRSQAPRLFS